MNIDKRIYLLGLVPVYVVSWIASPVLFFYLSTGTVLCAWLYFVAPSVDGDD